MIDYRCINECYAFWEYMIGNIFPMEVMMVNSANDVKNIV